MDQRSVSDLEKHIREPPQLAQIGIFHPLHKRRVQKSGVSILPTALCLLLSAYCSMDYADPLYRSAAFRTGQQALA
jgi:hypothetical protein